MILPSAITFSTVPPVQRVSDGVGANGNNFAANIKSIRNILSLNDVHGRPGHLVGSGSSVETKSLSPAIQPISAALVISYVDIEPKKNNRIIAGQERDIKGSELAFESKEKVSGTGKSVSPLALLSSEYFKKKAVVGDLITSQLRSLSPRTQDEVINGGNLIFTGLEVKHKFGSFGALRIVDTYAGIMPKQETSISAYWVPQGKSIDVPKHPRQGIDPEIILTPSFSGCSFVADELAGEKLRIYHVEGNKENVQYNDNDDHGLGLLGYMSYKDYGYNEKDGKTIENVTGFAFMAYNHETSVWDMHFQKQEHPPSIMSYQEKSGEYKFTTMVAKGERIVGDSKVEIKY
ncbi:cytotoxin [Shewanella sp. WE21]|jgi:insecticidal toxin complex protein TccC|uniref:cytotoxin n=1 Tax=Shewanella sp. WE21 TaxID=2029986 RepID=UPI000CF67618|nr:cytotoxin [Shewanella sp. WE21]AVI67783.1 cytotoxin [Shewanella sp. WE21]